MKPIAKIYNNFSSKFAIPRQSGLVSEVKSKIIFENEFSVPEAFRGLEEFSHIWIIWEFSENKDKKWSPTVRPPRLGGNKKMGVFATRSPFRPNPLGLSCVKLESIEHTKKHGTVLTVSGADIMNGTPIYDIKPYLPITDCIPDALSGFAKETEDYSLSVIIPDDIKSKLPDDTVKEVTSILKGDPRPGYHNDSDRIYGFAYGIYDFKFKVSDGTAYLCGFEIIK